MYINHDKKFVFIHVPKTAGSSIHVLFKNYFNVQDRSDPLPDIHHISISDLISKDKNLEKYYKFAVVRNPFARFYSGYKDFYQNRLTDRKYHPYHIDPKCSFKDFCENFLSSPWCEDVHFKPQKFFLTANQEIAVDEIVRHESINNDLSKVFFKIGLNAKLGKRHHRKTKDPFSSYREAYDDESREIVENFYKEDLKLFNYEF